LSDRNLYLPHFIQNKISHKLVWELNRVSVHACRVWDLSSAFIFVSRLLKLYIN